MLSFVFCALFVSSLAVKFPSGHLKPFGSHKKPSILTTELDCES